MTWWLFPGAKVLAICSKSISKWTDHGPGFFHLFNHQNIWHMIRKTKKCHDVFPVSTIIVTYCGWLRNHQEDGWRPVNNGMFTTSLNWCRIFSIHCHIQDYSARLFDEPAQMVEEMQALGLKHIMFQARILFLKLGIYIYILFICLFIYLFVGSKV